jgi:hypothetical protein
VNPEIGKTDAELERGCTETMIGIGIPEISAAVDGRTPYVESMGINGRRSPQ